VPPSLTKEPQASQDRPGVPSSIRGRQNAAGGGRASGHRPLPGDVADTGPLTQRGAVGYPF
jgi:hypothetical protein